MERADVDRPSRIGRAEVTEGSRTTDRALISRRTAIGGAFGAALVTLLARPEWATAQGRVVQEDFVILLQGRYKPVVDGPDLGLTMVDLSDGSYSKVKIYPVSGTPNSTHAPQAIGYFYVQFDGSLRAYKLPGGRASDGIHGVRLRCNQRRGGWGLLARNVRTNGIGGDGGLSVLCGWS